MDFNTIRRMFLKTNINRVRNCTNRHPYFHQGFDNHRLMYFKNQNIPSTTPGPTTAPAPIISTFPYTISGRFNGIQEWQRTTPSILIMFDSEPSLSNEARLSFTNTIEIISRNVYIDINGIPINMSPNGANIGSYNLTVNTITYCILVELPHLQSVSDEQRTNEIDPIINRINNNISNNISNGQHINIITVSDMPPNTNTSSTTTEPTLADPAPTFAAPARSYNVNTEPTLAPPASTYNVNNTDPTLAPTASTFDTSNSTGPTLAPSAPTFDASNSTGPTLAPVADSDITPPPSQTTSSANNANNANNPNTGLKITLTFNQNIRDSDMNNLTSLIRQQIINISNGDINPSDILSVMFQETSNKMDIIFTNTALVSINPQKSAQLTNIIQNKSSKYEQTHIQ